jgi:proteasome lid subunit RPN8/RPN11
MCSADFQQDDTMKEICFVLAGDAIIRISVGSTTAIPDSQQRWETIWENREALTEIAHTHPGGLLRFSQEDLTTMEAVEGALGKPLAWSIVTTDGFLTRFDGEDRSRDDTPWWLPVLRELSFGSAQPGATTTTKGDDDVSSD